MQNPPPPNRNPMIGRNDIVDPRWLDYFNLFQQGAASAIAPYVITTADATLTGAEDLGLLATGYTFLTVAAAVAAFSTVPAIPQRDLRWATVTKTFADTGFVASAGQMVLTDATGGATTIKLPAGPSDGQSVIVKKTDASGNAVTISGNGVNVDGAGTHGLAAQWNSAICVFSASFGAWAIAGQV